jgi:hypothetical protein
MSSYEKPPRTLNSGLLRIAALIAVAVVVGLVVWLLVKDDDEGPTGQGTGPGIVSPADLRSFAASVGHEVYWAGELPGRKIELTQTQNGNVYVRYLRGNAVPADPRPFLTISTYPVANALEAVKGVQGKGNITRKLPGGGLVLTSRESPANRSVYLAYPGSNYEVEVYDLSPKRSFQTAASGKVVPIS